MRSTALCCFACETLAFSLARLSRIELRPAELRRNRSIKPNGSNQFLDDLRHQSEGFAVSAWRLFDGRRYSRYDLFSRISGE
jgi:hypothetical protein